jgi:hypothetical protein
MGNDKSVRGNKRIDDNDAVSINYNKLFANNSGLAVDTE